MNQGKRVGWRVPVDVIVHSEPFLSEEEARAAADAIVKDLLGDLVKTGLIRDYRLRVEPSTEVKA